MGYSQLIHTSINILHYQAHIEPNINNQTIQGKVKVQFTGETDLTSSLSLDCGDLTIDSVIHANTRRAFVQKDHQVHIDISNFDTTSNQEVSIHYHGKPRYGIQFFPESKQVYTVFSTSQWMPCRDAIDERATFELNLILPEDLIGIGNGALKAKKTLPDDKVQYTWKSTVAVPSYIFGFAAGQFKSYGEQYKDTKLHYLSSDYSEEELQQIFVETPAMVQFFEDKAGVPYPGERYTQILPKGRASQEMTNFTVMRNKYGEQVLERPRDINLAAHELAHQWWGNQVTCQNWNHFWLNEGMAVFMSSAYKEHRFGRGVYLEDIEVYRKAYQTVVDKGLDKSLVFPDWKRPTAEDRTLVYYKGAYFIHLLREEVGDAVFWEAIRNYTRNHFGKAVVSKDLQVAMEAVSGQDLSGLFEAWVY